MGYKGYGGSGDLSNRTVLLVLVLVMVVSVVSLGISVNAVRQAGEVASAVKAATDVMAKQQVRKADSTEAVAGSKTASDTGQVMINVVSPPDGA